MIGQMAIAITLPAFNDLGRSVIPIFLLTDHFSYRFSMKITYRLELEFAFFAKKALRLSMRRFQMPLEGICFVGNIQNYLPNRRIYTKYD